MKKGTEKPRQREDATSSQNHFCPSRDESLRKRCLPVKKSQNRGAKLVALGGQRSKRKAGNGQSEGGSRSLATSVGSHPMEIAETGAGTAMIGQDEKKRAGLFSGITRGVLERVRDRHNKGPAMVKRKDTAGLLLLEGTRCKKGKPERKM